MYVYIYTHTYIYIYIYTHTHKHTYADFLEKVKGSELLRKYKEDQWIIHLDTIYPHGLNMHLSDFGLLYSSLFK